MRSLGLLLDFMILFESSSLLNFIHTSFGFAVLLKGFFYRVSTMKTSAPTVRYSHGEHVLSSLKWQNSVLKIKQRYGAISSLAPLLPVCPLLLSPHLTSLVLKIVYNLFNIKGLRCSSKTFSLSARIT